MALVSNGNMARVAGMQYAGASAYLSAIPSALRSNFAGTNRQRNLTAGEGITDDTVGLPLGCRHPVAWMMPQKAGALSARNKLTGSGSVSGTALAVRLALADLAGSGDISDALGGLIVQALADLTGSGDISDANLQAFLAAVASLTGSGGITSANASGLGELIGAIGGTGEASATLTAIGELIAALTVTGTGLSTANVGEAVWGALAAANNGAGTMGEKLNDAGSGSNPWTEVIESGYTAAQILRLIAAAVQGDASGLESGAPTFKGLDGTTDRITATYGSGTRTVTGRDGD